MAKIKYKKMIIEVKPDLSGKITGRVISSGDTPQEKVDIMNQNLESLVKVYTPKPGDYALSASNAITQWIANGLGAEVLEYDKVEQDPDAIY